VRIVSLVPNATEILFAIGAGRLVVGRSHECDYPRAAQELPVLTGSALAAGLAASAVDQAVSAQLASGASLYTLDQDQIAALAPDLIFTQELCPVCAVSTEQVASALAPIPHCPRIVSLDPKFLDDVWRDIRHVGTEVGHQLGAERLLTELAARIAIVRADAGGSRPRVAALEWLDPPFAAGHWVPEMIALAGGSDIFATPGAPSRRLSWNEVAAADPDEIVAMPCGFDAAGAARQVAALADEPGWQNLRAVRQGRVHSVDANGCFSRPGPRLVDGIEALARCWSHCAEPS
jgi:iron complex transport system substrate-binding protein